ncbi:MAG: histidine kinase [Opitutae bacterium]|nr:histidine kinase [Opitutae bacterium]
MSSAAPFSGESLREAGDREAVITFRHWWWLPTGWVALGFLFSIQPWLSGFMPFGDNVRFAALRLVPWAFVAPAAVWLCLHFPIAGPRWPRALLVHAVASVIAVLCLESTATFFDWPRPDRGRFFVRTDGRGSGSVHVFGFNDAGGPPPPPPDESGTATVAAGASSVNASGIAAPPDEPERGTRADVRFDRAPRQAPSFEMFSDDHGGGPRTIRTPPPWFLRGRQSFPLYCCLVAFAHVLYLQRAARRAAQAEAQLTAARLAALQLQLQPHFLFNSLNAISSLVRADADVADEMICSLGALLHASLDNSGRAEITFTEEMQMVQHYLRIQQVRFGDALKIETRIDTSATVAAIPTLSLQPLVENAIIHGLRGRAGTLRIGAWRRDDRLIVEITDEPDGAAANDEPPRKPTTGVGLKNIRARLDTLYGARAALDLIRTPAGATARLEVPFRELGEA